MYIHQSSNEWMATLICPGGQRKFRVNLQTKQPRASAEKFPGGGGEATEKRSKNSQKRPKNSTVKPLPGEGGQRKKDRKIAPLSLYLIYLYHVWKSRGPWPRCQRPYKQMPCSLLYESGFYKQQCQNLQRNFS